MLFFVLFYPDARSLDVCDQLRISSKKVLRRVDSMMHFGHIMFETPISWIRLLFIQRLVSSQLFFAAKVYLNYLVSSQINLHLRILKVLCLAVEYDDV